ncbi:MAG: hypothetical protein J1E95_11695, partial [Muribaculaceae bacterium]|nr:hypothetical protein [Muribaculaceae bacterium]
PHLTYFQRLGQNSLTQPLNLRMSLMVPPNIQVDIGAGVGRSPSDPFREAARCRLPEYHIHRLLCKILISNYSSAILLVPVLRNSRHPENSATNSPDI